MIEDPELIHRLESHLWELFDGESEEMKTFAAAMLLLIDELERIEDKLHLIHVNMP